MAFTHKFCWWELNTPDIESSKTFYTQLLDWDFEDMPMGEDDFYTFAKSNDIGFSGMTLLTSELQAEEVKPHWMPFIATPNLDETFERVLFLGAESILDPVPVFEKGRMATFRDPVGATVSLWETKTAEHSLSKEPGRVSWVELETNNMDVGAGFYAKAFGWRPEIMPMGDTQYTMLMSKDGEQAGVFQYPEEMSDMGSRWSTYFNVTDIDAKTNWVRENGGKVIKEPTEIPVGRFSVLMDPHGACFNLFQGR